MRLTLHRALVIGGVGGIVFAFVWVGFHPTAIAPAGISAAVGALLLRASAYEWGNRRKR